MLRAQGKASLRAELDTRGWRAYRLHKDHKDKVEIGNSGAQAGKAPSLPLVDGVAGYPDGGNRVGRWPVQFSMVTRPIADLALPRERLASPAGRQTGVAELFFEIVKGLQRQAQFSGFHKLPHLHLRGSGRSAGQARNASAANEHRLDASLPRVLFSFVQARSCFIRFRTNESVVNELLLLKARAREEGGQIAVFFIDDNFAINVKRTKSLLRDIIAAGAQCHWVAQISANLLRDEELVDLIAASGGKWIFIGMESIDPANLKDVNKGFNKPGEYAAVLERLAQRNVYAITSFIF